MATTELLHNFLRHSTRFMLPLSFHTPENIGVGSNRFNKTIKCLKSFDNTSEKRRYSTKGRYAPAKIITEDITLIWIAYYFTAEEIFAIKSIFLILFNTFFHSYRTFADVTK